MRSILCTDTSFQTCDRMALEIQHLLVGESALISPTSSGPSHDSLSRNFVHVKSVF